MRLAIFYAPGWVGVRLARIYVTLVDRSRHPPVFTERHNSGGYRGLFMLRGWQCGVRL